MLANLCVQIYKLPKIAIIFDELSNFSTFQICAPKFSIVLNLCTQNFTLPNYCLGLKIAKFVHFWGKKKLVYKFGKVLNLCKESLQGA